MADWVTISSLATAGGTLVLAVATFTSVRSANRVARTAERSLMAGLRPLLVGGRMDDPPQKVQWGDEHWSKVGGGSASVELTDDVIYLVLPLRNVGSGIGVLHGWYTEIVDWVAGDGEDPGHAEPDAFRRQSLDLYIAPSDVGFWQGAIRGRDDPSFARLEEMISERRRFAIQLLYGDAEGGQRTISRFSVAPRSGDEGWLCRAVRHWNLDRPDPR